MLSLLALAVALAIGIPIGIASAVYRNSWLDQASLTLVMLGAAVPSFWLGLSLIVVFAVNLGWLPSSGFRPPDEGLWRSLALPDPPCHRARRAELRPHHPLRAREPARRHRDRLRAHRAGQGAGRAGGHLPPRAPERAGADPHRGGAHVRGAHGRRGGHGDGVQHPRHRAAGGPVGAAAGLPRDPGRDPDRRGVLRPHQPPGGRALPRGRPAGEVLGDGRARPGDPAPGARRRPPRGRHAAPADGAAAPHHRTGRSDPAGDARRGDRRPGARAVRPPGHPGRRSACAGRRRRIPSGRTSSGGTS